MKVVGKSTQSKDERHRGKSNCSPSAVPSQKAAAFSRFLLLWCKKVAKHKSFLSTKSDI